ncbi:MAG: cytochrome c [Fibrella sp.]|nr:cytochrome c [Armatimonadota bacterium]
MRVRNLLFLALTVMAAMLTLAATKPPARTDDAPTWSRDVAPIVYKNCTPCHRKGEAGPFPLEGYTDAKRMASMLALVTRKRLMPPWKPVAGHGDFREERTLTDAEITVIGRWAAAGATAGDVKTAPPPPKFRTGWQLGTPDMILEMPAAFPIPAEGRDVYQRFVFPLNLSKDRYLRGIEVRPGNRRIAHHAIGILDTSGTARKLDAKTPEQGYSSMGSSGFLPAGLTPGYVPGQTPRFFAEGSPLTLPKKSDFVLEMHYHPSGKPETDRTVVGLYFTDKKPVKNPTGILLASEEIDIPAGKSAYIVSDKFVLPTALNVTNVWAHMHMVGKKVRVWAELPDGSTEKMLLINDWDFNWQDTYQYEKPIRLPKGTVLHSEWVFDNTDANPRNPNSPPKRVRLGENSTDEMTGLWVGGLADDGWGELSLLGANIGHYFEITGKGKPFKQGK